VPELVVRRRFGRSLRNFLLHYRELADAWTLFDNSGKVPQVIASERNKRVHMIKKGVYTSLVSQYGHT